MYGEVSALALGNHGAQMLKQIKDRCSRQIPSSPKNSSPNLIDHDIYRDICLFDNLPATTPAIQFKAENGLPVNPGAQEQWLNKAALNAGWAIYEYVRQATATDVWQPSPADCDQTDLSTNIPRHEPSEPAPSPGPAVPPAPSQPPAGPTPPAPPGPDGQPKHEQDHCSPKDQRRPPWW